MNKQESILMYIREKNQRYISGETRLVNKTVDSRSIHKAIIFTK